MPIAKVLTHIRLDDRRNNSLREIRIHLVAADCARWDFCVEPSALHGRPCASGNHGRPTPWPACDRRVLAAPVAATRETRDRKTTRCTFARCLCGLSDGVRRRSGRYLSSEPRQLGDLVRLHRYPGEAANLAPKVRSARFRRSDWMRYGICCDRNL